MRFSTSSALLLGAASSTTALQQDQKVLGEQHNDQQSVEFGAEPEAESWWASLEDLWGEASAEVKAVWDDVSVLAPGALDGIVNQAKALGAESKKINRRPDSEWDIHVKGAEVGDIFTQVDGAPQKIDGDFSNYALRARHVDPAKLGVDKVKQYSGYLDANEEDKHLFFCKSAI